MTDKEKMQHILDIVMMDDMESIMGLFLFYYKSDISLSKLNEMRKQIQEVIDTKIEDYSKLRFIANERASYLQKYLSGKMWSTEEIAKQYLEPQIDNAQAIIDACKEVK